MVGRARSLDGPDEWHHALTQGSTSINRPHQGGWLQTADGRVWFVHFQQRGAHGRIVWLEPMRWLDDWPLMGTAATSLTPGTDPAGMPLLTALGSALPQGTVRPQTSEECDNPKLSPMWK